MAANYLYPLNAPGMPVPGADFRSMVMDYGDELLSVKGKGKNETLEFFGPIAERLTHSILHSRGYQNFRITLSPKGGRRASLPVVGGHLWKSNHRGPRPSDVMVIGKMLGDNESLSATNLAGVSGQLFEEILIEYEQEEVTANWYVTNVLKTVYPDPNASNSTLKASWIREWLPFLHQELRIVRPKFILCLGADASKALLGPKATLTSMEGRVVEYAYPVHRSVHEEEKTHTALVMAINNPAAVVSAPETEEKFRNGVARFVQLTHGQRWDLEEEDLDHRLVDDLETLRALEYEINADIEDNLLGVDAEWHGQHPQNEGAYLRSFQVSWRHKSGAYIALTRQGGKKVYEDPAEEKEALEIICRICEGRQLAGHFFDADLEFLVAFGIDLRKNYRAADNWVDYMEEVLQNRACGFDTGLAAHAANETDDFGLTYQALRYTTAPRYDIMLLEWKKQYCTTNNMKSEELEGYGDCPDRILAGVLQGDGTLRNSYAVYDADVTRRLALVARKRLTADHLGNNCWEAMWISMRAFPAVLEINCKGVMVDKDRIDILTNLYVEARKQLSDRVRLWARWPDFNIQSVFHVREFLFGEKLNGHEVEPGAPPRRRRPKEARSLFLDPVLSTDKRPMPWSEVVQQKLTEEKTPGTNKMALALLAQENQAVRRVVGGKEKTFDFSRQVNWIRDFRFISQVLKSSLRPPLFDKNDVIRKDDSGHYVYAGGIAGSICDDGRVRTHMYQTKETGRWSSARPPLHNLGKRREQDYKRILGDSYKYPLRTIICASPGKVVVEADYIGAELFGMAVLSGDSLMIEHARRNQLPEEHPDHYDIHSNIAVLAFRLNCPPTKTGLAEAKLKHLRIVAKAVIFGVAYGRGAKAIALAAKEEKVNVSVADAQKVIDTIFKTYPGLVTLFEACRERALQERWLCNCFGRMRRFPRARETRVQGDFERQAMNFPVQGMIADAVSRAADELIIYRESLGDTQRWFDLLLQIHDALLFAVDYKDVAWLIEEVLPECMVRRVPIYPTTPDGSPVSDPAAPYYLGIDTELGIHWGEDLHPEQFVDLGIPLRLGGWREYRDGWRHETKKQDCYWRGGKWQKI